MILLKSIIFLLLFCNSSVLSSENNKENIPPCRACKLFVESYKKTIKKSSKINKSVLLQICNNNPEKDSCLNIIGEHEAFLLNFNPDSDLLSELCIDKLKRCCPELHFGENCTPCAGYPDDVCHNNGKCKGSGTRKGNGQCLCDPGYVGEKCNKCAENYFVAYQDAKKLLCTKCHPSCDGNCNKSGPEGCEKCASGWSKDHQKGCIDINECLRKNACLKNQFCVNNDGSFSCLECDRACSGCTGDGPDMCIHCASGHILKDGVCVDEEQESRRNYVSLTRYLTYIGLCVATCIIFNKNMIVAAVIGIAVAVYISASEYILHTPPTPKTDNLAQQIIDQLNRES